MYGSTAALAYEEAESVAAAPAFAKHQSSKSLNEMPGYSEGISMGTSFSNTHGFNRGERYSNPGNWLREFFSATPAKVIANDAGINLRAAEAIKQGRNGLTMAHLENLCKSNPAFRAAWFAERCGGILEGEPELVAALSKAINAVVRARQ